MKLIDGYYVKDLNGRIYWCEDMPEKLGCKWAVDTNKIIELRSGCIQIDGPWEDSLHKVEDGKITRVQTYSKDQPVLVSDEGENCQDRRWYRRYYSHYKDGKHYVFSCGADSWSASDNQVVARPLIKPAEEE